MSETMTSLLEVRRGLGKERKLSELWHEFSQLWQDLGWQQAQVRLWLATLPGVEITHGDSNDPYFLVMGEKQDSDDLAEAIFSLINEVGRPLPIAQLKSQLSSSLAATEPMIKAAVKNHYKLVIMGPVVKIK